MMSEDLKELLKFRSEWKKELENSRKTLRGDSKEQQKDHLNGDSLVIQNEEDLKRYKNEISRSVGMLDCVEKSVSGKEISEECRPKELVLLNLPNPEAKQQEHRNEDNPKKQKTDKTADENLLDVLIADIDEITVIPFFDLQLPREIGLKIFRCLSVQDLCHCASVSKSWRNLAEDELLWFNLGVQLGFVDDKTPITDQAGWKMFVHASIIKERQLRSRWKERICRIDAMEYERGGSLCAVSLCDGLLCSGYSSNAILLWKLKENQRPTFKLLDVFPDGQQHAYPTCTAVTETLCAAGFSNGNVNLWHTSLSTSPLYHCRLEGPVQTIALATNNEPTSIAASSHDLRIDVADVNGHWTCYEQKTFENQIQGIKYLPRRKDATNDSILIATRDTLHLKNITHRNELTVVDHVIGGKVTCLDCNLDVVAVGVGSYGYGVLGNTVRLYCTDTGRLLSVLHGHYHEVTCLNVEDSPPQRLVTGSYDKRVRIYDLRTEAIALDLRGHQDHVTTVQMDDWKVVSGANNGSICVWDQRTATVLWHTHARHPVRFCHFEGVKMISANIPNDKVPLTDSWYADDLILHRRSRGSLRMFDFSTDNATQGVPEICSSSYDDISGYNYNIALVTPYDDINK